MARNDIRLSKGKGLRMSKVSIVRAFRLLAVGGALLLTTGCLGPNPLFFIGSTATGASVGRIVNMLFDALLAGG